MKALVAGPAHAGIHIGQAIHHAQQLLGAGHLRLGGYFLGQLGAQVLRSGLGIGLVHQQRAEVLDEVCQKAAQLLAGLVLLIHGAQGIDGVAFQNVPCQGGHGFAGGEAKDIQHVLLGDLVSAEGHELIQHGLRIAHAALRALADGVGGLFIEVHTLQLRDVQQVLGNDRIGDAAQVKALAAADDGGQDLVGLRGGKDELHVLRRLLQRLEQRIEGPGGEHVHLVDVVDLVPAAGGGVFDVVAQLAHLLHAVVARAVDLQHVHAATFGDLQAQLVLGVKVDARPVLAAQGLGKDTRRGGLAGATRPHKEVGMRQTLLGDGIAQRAHDVFLAEHIGKRLGAVFAGKNLVTHPLRLTKHRGEANGSLQEH